MAKRESPLYSQKKSDEEFRALIVIFGSLKKNSYLKLKSNSKESLLVFRRAFHINYDSVTMSF